MASRDGGLHEGYGAEVPEIGAGDPQSSSFALAASVGGALSLDEAESIAARRLRELAIRLGDDDGAEHDDAPFDADRHFRTQLAVRLTRQTRDAHADRTPSAAIVPLAREVPYLVTDALPLTAYGDRLAGLCRGGGAPMIAHAPAQANFFHLFEQSAKPAASSPEATAEASDAADARDRSDAAADRENEGLLRLVDFLNERDALADRLANLSLAQDAAAPDKAEPSLFDVVAAMANGSSRSDAEHLFDAGTYDAEVFQAGGSLQHRQESDKGDENASGGMSAEQLIAVLNQANAPRQELAPASQAPPADVRAVGLRMLGEDDTTERAPMIIERARAERNGSAGSYVPGPARQPSAVIGFLAGLSFSLVIGAVLYLML